MSTSCLRCVCFSTNFLPLRTTRNSPIELVRMGSGTSAGPIAPVKLDSSSLSIPRASRFITRMELLAARTSPSARSCMRKRYFSKECVSNTVHFLCYTYVDNTVRAAPTALGDATQLGTKALQVKHKGARVATKQVTAFLAHLAHFVMIVKRVTSTFFLVAYWCIDGRLRSTMYPFLPAFV